MVYIASLLVEHAHGAEMQPSGHEHESCVTTQGVARPMHYIVSAATAAASAALANSGLHVAKVCGRQHCTVLNPITLSVQPHAGLNPVAPIC